MKKIFFAIALLSLIACEKKEAHKNGKGKGEVAIDILSIDPEVIADTVCGELDPRLIQLKSGEKLILEFRLEAPGGLSQYKIDIHSNFDCHSHKSVELSELWKVLKIVDVDNAVLDVREELTVPENTTAGDYHFMLQAIDQKGNEAPFVLYNIKVDNSTDTEKPEIQILDPSSGFLTVAKGEELSFRTKVMDNEFLKGGKVEVTYTNPSGMEFTADQHFFTEEMKSVAYDFRYSFPGQPESGEYLFRLKAYDAVGNTAEKYVSVNVN